MKQSVEELKEHLNDILPFGKLCDDRTILDLPQFMDEYLSHVQAVMIERYPHEKGRIQKSYKHVLADIKQERLF